MKHQQYETWILMDGDLSQDEHRDLQGHLKQCSQCQSLYQATHQIARLFKTAPAPAPKPDFSARWINRMEKVENRKNRLILSITLAVISVATLVLLSSVGIQLRSSLTQFPQIFMELVTLIARWIVFINQLSDIAKPLFRVSIKLISPIWLYTFGVSIIGITAAWMVSLFRSRTLQKELQQ
jgi:hypothetical protein